MTAAPKVLLLTTLPDSRCLAKVGESISVVPLRLDQPLHTTLDALDAALNLYPPTSLAKANPAWLSAARELGRLLTLQAERAAVRIDWDRLPEHFSQVVVAAERVIPVDVIPCRKSLLGTECVTAHSVGSSAGEVLPILLRSLEPEHIHLRRIAHVCTYDPGETSLYDMDVVGATLRPNNRLAIEHYFYPTIEVAMGLFKRTDVDVLHFECHGTATSLQIDNPLGQPCDVRTLQIPNGPSVYFFLGCQAGEHVDAVAPSFVRHGARTTIGSYCTFFSGGESGELATSALKESTIARSYCLAIQM